MDFIRNFVMAPRYQTTGFFVRGTGHFSIVQKELVKQAHYGEIFWCVRGCGVVLFEEAKYVLRPGFIFYFPPGSRHDFTPDRGGCDYYWVSLEGGISGALFESLGIFPGLQEAGECPEELFLQLDEYLRNSIPESQLKALSIAFEILTRVVTPRPGSLSGMEPVKDYMDLNFQNKELDINGIARHFHLHRVSLSRRFRARFGIAPGDYLSSLRMQKGISLLMSTGLPIKEIAEKCGFASADYFTKVIRKAAGVPPGALRSDHK